MNFRKCKYLFLLVCFFISLSFYSACDGIFPSQTKSYLPSDHNSRLGGYYHKPINRNGGADECNECHGRDLRGAVYNFNGTLVFAQSCYQCHGNVWEDNGGGEDK
jgi:hypothetical protein